jgi:hypothetical protein
MSGKLRCCAVHPLHHLFPYGSAASQYFSCFMLSIVLYVTEIISHKLALLHPFSKSKVLVINCSHYTTGVLISP